MDVLGSAIRHGVESSLGTRKQLMKMLACCSECSLTVVFQKSGACWFYQE